jgi:nucleotide-binding universal stress UspA family protein
MAIYKKILLATDLAKRSDHARTAAVAFARAQGAELHLLHINVLSALHMEYRGLKRADEYVRTVMRASEKALKDVPDEEGIKIVREVQTGQSPGQMIMDYASANNIDLICMGMDRADGVKRFFMGSVTMKVLNGAKRPVCIVGRDTKGKIPPKHIVVATDLSEPSGLAVAHAAELAASLETRLTVMHAIEPPLATPYDLKQVMKDPDPKKGQKALDDFLGPLQLAVTPETRIEKGPSARTISDSARKLNADLLVVAAAGHASAVERLILGSTADRVARIAPCPVLVHRKRSR